MIVKDFYIFDEYRIKAKMLQDFYKVDALSQVINDQTFIGGYESKHMKMIENVSRLSYSMYLNEEACKCFKGNV